MSLIAILAALALEQWRAFEWRAGVERAFVRYARSLERKLNDGTRQHGAFAAVAAVVPPVLGATLVWWLADAAHWGLGLLANVAVLYFLMGFRRFSHAISAIVAALAAADLPAARRALVAWRGGSAADLGSSEIARLAIERGLVDAYPACNLFPAEVPRHLPDADRVRGEWRRTRPVRLHTVAWEVPGQFQEITAGSHTAERRRNAAHSR